MQPGEELGFPSPQHFQNVLEGTRVEGWHRDIMFTVKPQLRVRFPEASLSGCLYLWQSRDSGTEPGKG